MNYASPSATQQPENLQLAVSMANELLSRFSLSEQNEAIALICQRVREVRINEAHELEMRIEIIKKSLESVPIPEMNGAAKNV